MFLSSVFSVVCLERCGLSRPHRAIFRSSIPSYSPEGALQAPLVRVGGVSYCHTQQELWHELFASRRERQMTRGGCVKIITRSGDFDASSKVSLASAAIFSRGWVVFCFFKTELETGRCRASSRMPVVFVGHKHFAERQYVLLWPRGSFLYSPISLVPSSVLRFCFAHIVCVGGSLSI
jgi:hypothetical protein